MITILRYWACGKVVKKEQHLQALGSENVSYFMILALFGYNQKTSLSMQLPIAAKLLSIYVALHANYRFVTNKVLKVLSHSRFTWLLMKYSIFF